MSATQVRMQTHKWIHCLSILASILAVHAIAVPRLWNALLGAITDCKSIGAFKRKVLRHIGLNLLLIRCNLFSCIFICHVNHLRTAWWIWSYIYYKCFIIMFQTLVELNK